MSDRGTRGSATLLALLMTGVIITVGIGFNWIVKEHLKAADGMKRKSEAMLKAVSTYNTLIYSILAGRATNQEVVFTGTGDLLGVKSVPLNGHGVTVSDDVEIKVQDGNGLISLDNPNFRVLRKLLLDATQGENKSAVIIDSYIDWITKGNIPSPNGAKDAYYKAEGKPYTARNHAVQYKEELSFVRGMDRELYKKIAPYVTLLPSTGFNPNTAPDEVLMAYLNIDADSLQVLKAYMLKMPVASQSDLLKTIGKSMQMSEGSDFFPSRFFDIIISVGKPEPVYSLKAGIDRSWNPTYPYSVLYWEKG